MVEINIIAESDEFVLIDLKQETSDYMEVVKAIRKAGFYAPGRFSMPWELLKGSEGHIVVFPGIPSYDRAEGWNQLSAIEQEDAKWVSISVWSSRWLSSKIRFLVRRRHNIYGAFPWFPQEAG